MSQGWCTIESDPGVFTELIQDGFGCKNVQVEELWDFEDETFNRLKPIYGLIFLFKWQEDKRENLDIPVVKPQNLFYAKQVINNACATQAIISVLLNRDEVQLGPTLSNFKSFAGFLDAHTAGEQLGQEQNIRKAHNSFARPEPFSFEDSKKSDDDEAFHFVAYVPNGGQVWELDGLKKGPIRLGECTLDNWLPVARKHIKDRIASYSGELRFTLLGLVHNIQEKMQKELSSLNADQDVARITQLQDGIKQEQEKFKRWKNENVRRRHNYVPFIFNLLKILARKGKLKPLVEKAVEMKKVKNAAEEKREKEKKEKEEAAKKANETEGK